MPQKLMPDGTFSELPQRSTPSSYSSLQQMSEVNCVQWIYAVVPSLISYEFAECLGRQSLPPTDLGRVDEEMASPGGRPLQD
ncbi:hypothetical protein TNCV_3108911 [Trichonephila clavipes]|nr:hypothetical protein TNCV_3108911 [Trichonephila clavipes]